MRLRRRWVLVVACFLLLALAGSGQVMAQNFSWSDITPEILNTYGVTEAELGAISSGFDSETWGPFRQMTRAQFVKMAVEAFDLPKVSPPVQTFLDVPPDHIYFTYVETAYAEGLVLGTIAPGGGRYFGLNDAVTRQHGAAIIARHVAEQRMIDLDAAYNLQDINDLLGPYVDDGQITPGLRAELAAAVDWGILLGTADGYLHPARPLTRIQGATLLIRSAEDVTPPSSTTTTTVPSTTTTTEPPSTTTTTAPPNTTTTTLPPSTTTTEPPPQPTLTRDSSGLLLEDDFTGSDGDPFDAVRWTEFEYGSSSGAGVAEIRDNQGYLQVDNENQNGAILSNVVTDQADQEVTLEVAMNSGQRSYLGIALRGDGDLLGADHFFTPNYYMAEFLGGHWSITEPGPYRVAIYKRESGVFNEPYPGFGGSDAEWLSDGNPWRVRLRMEGYQISCKFWRPVDPEPSTWNVQITDPDSTFASGAFGVFLSSDQNHDGVTQLFAKLDDLEVRTGYQLSVTGLPAGYKVRATVGLDSKTATESGGTAILDLTGLWQSLDSLEVLDGSDNVVATLTSADYPDMGGGDVYTYTE